MAESSSVLFDFSATPLQTILTHTHSRTHTNTLTHTHTHMHMHTQSLFLFKTLSHSLHIFSFYCISFYLSLCRVFSLCLWVSVSLCLYLFLLLSLILSLPQTRMHTHTNTRTHAQVSLVIWSRFWISYFRCVVKKSNWSLMFKVKLNNCRRVNLSWHSPPNNESQLDSLSLLFTHSNTQT